MDISFEVDKQIITRTDSNKVVADSRNYLFAEFTLSDDWTGIVTAVFKKDGTAYSAILDENYKCAVPWEVISEGRFSVSCFCSDRITANKAFVPVIASGYEEGETPSEPTPDVYSRLIELGENAVNAANTVFTAYENGELKGEKGDMAQADFSLSEHRIGSWVDGKPLYERSYSITLPSVSTESVLSAIDASVFDTIVKFSALVTESGQDGAEIFAFITPVENSYYRTNSERLQMYFYRSYTSPEDSAIKVYCGTKFVSKPAVITLWYTKVGD